MSRSTVLLCVCVCVCMCAEDEKEMQDSTIKGLGLNELKGINIWLPFIFK